MGFDAQEMASEGAARRLAAILFTDIVGYTALMAESEQKGLRAREQHRVLVRECVGLYSGEAIEARGDESLSVFYNVLDAVNCALAIQDRLREQELELHVGIHLGDIVVAANEVSGDGVNIAARLCALSEAGGVWVSGEVHHSVRNQAHIEARDLGAQQLRNVGRPVQVIALSGPPGPPSQRWTRDAGRRVWRVGAMALGLGLLIALGWWSWQRVAPPTSAGPFAGRPAIAVLPFQDMTGGSGPSYLADGLTEDLITRLASWRSFPVIARNSSFEVASRFESGPVDIVRAARELGARYVIEGSVRQTADRVRIAVQLIDATTGHHVWAQTYDREYDDILLLQDEISRTVVGAMYPSLSKFERGRAIRLDPASLDAWGQAQRGWWHLSRETPDDNAKARQFFQDAIELDPLWSSALAGLALAHFRDAANQWTGPEADSAGRLRITAEKAVALDDQDASAHHALGHAYALSGRPDQMIAAFELGARLNPNDASANRCLGAHLAWVGRSQEAIEHLVLARTLSPRDPWTAEILLGLAWAHFGAGEFEESLDWAEQSIAQKPNALAYQVVAASAGHLGRLEQGRAAVKDVLRLQPKFSRSAIRQFFAPADPGFVQRLIDGLRKVGFLREQPKGHDKGPSMKM